MCTPFRNRSMNPTTHSTSSPDFGAIAERYARDVIALRVPAGRYVRRAAQRHLDDVERSQSPTWPYEFDVDRGAKVCRFISALPHTKGRWAAKGERIDLTKSPWQCFLVVIGFGWLRKANGKRRFREFYWEIPRKNGKSLLAAAIGLYMLSADGEFGAEIYSGATSEKQAHEVFKPARLMAMNTPRLTQRLGVEVWAKSIVVEAKGSLFAPIIGNPGDGASPSCAIVDEYHEHQTSNLYDTMITGMGAREQPLALVITTAGTNIAGPCYDKHDEVTKVLDDVFENDHLFGVIFGIDETDDWADPKTLVKANPNYGVSIDPEFLQSQQRAAMASPIQQTAFKTKHLNVWCSVLNGWMNMQTWGKNARPLMDEDELAESEKWFALDLASKSDLCSEQRLYRRLEDDGDLGMRMHYYLFGRYWLPEAAIELEGPNQAHYKKWVTTGLLTQTDGATVDFKLITETIIDDCKRLNPLEVVYDPFNATQMAQALMEVEITCVEFTQTPQNFAVPMDELESALKDGRFHHDGNEITTWCFSNVVGRPSKKGLLAPTKQKAHQKIDGGVAAIMAMARAAAPHEDTAPQLFFV